MVLREALNRFTGVRFDGFFVFVVHVVRVLIVKVHAALLRGYF